MTGRVREVAHFGLPPSALAFRPGPLSAPRRRHERFEKLRNSWPALPPARIDGVDLLACEHEKAEGTVAALAKKPDAAAGARSAVRNVRALAETYPLQQRLFELATFDVEIALVEFDAPPSRGDVEKKSTVSLTRQLLDAEDAKIRALVRFPTQSLRGSWGTFLLHRLSDHCRRGASAALTFGRRAAISCLTLSNVASFARFFHSSGSASWSYNSSAPSA